MNAEQNRANLESQARDLSLSELHQVLNWDRALAAHYDENFDFHNYNMAQARITVVRAELARRGERF